MKRVDLRSCCVNSCTQPQPSRLLLFCHSTRDCCCGGGHFVYVTVVVFIAIIIRNNVVVKFTPNVAVLEFVHSPLTDKS